MRVPLRVLIAEDSEDDARLVLRALERAGYQPAFERVDSPAAMAAALDRQSWDVVIGDYSMPAFSGPAAPARLKPAMKVLYASGYGENAIAHHGIPESGIRYLRKPFAPEMLARRVRDVLDSSGGS